MTPFIRQNSVWKAVTRGLLLSAAFPFATLMAQSNFVAFEFERENNWDQQLSFADLNGDGLQDIVHANFQPGIGRELHIFHQQADGSFSNSAQRVEIKTEIIAIGFADLREEPGEELLLLSNSGAFSLSTAIEGYGGNIKALVEIELIAAVPDRERVQFLPPIEDLNQDGQVDLVLPEDGSYSVFLGRGNETFEKVTTFSTLNENIAQAQRGRSGSGLDARISINAEEGVVVEVNADSNSYFEGFVEQWTNDSAPARSLLRAENWMPTAIVAQLNADSLLDIAYLNEADDGAGQLNLHFQNDNGSYNVEADWIGSLDTRGDIQLLDADGDGLQDILRVAGEGNERTAYFYRNTGGAFALEQANQLMRFSGYDVRLNVLTLDADSTPLLNVSYYTIPVVDAIRNASINRTQLLFGSDEVLDDQFFNRRPSSSLEESFSAANVRGLSEQMSLQYDIDGDGRNDAVYVTERGTLAAKRITTGLFIEEEPFWEYVSERGVFEFEVRHLNEDTKPDILLRHATATTVLVAAP